MSGFDRCITRRCRFADIAFAERRGSACQHADVAQRVEVVEGFEMILERLAADRDALLDDQGRLGGRQGVALDRVRRVGQFQVVRMLEIGERTGCPAQEPVELGLLAGNDGAQILHAGFHIMARPPQIHVRDRTGHPMRYNRYLAPL